ncbi:MAG: hypothetical protein ACLQIQ_18495 [Beijerinckiaceae bacterium]
MKDDGLRIERSIPAPPAKVHALRTGPDRLVQFGRTEAGSPAV